MKTELITEIFGNEPSLLRALELRKIGPRMLLSVLPPSSKRCRSGLNQVAPACMHNSRIELRTASLIHVAQVTHAILRDNSHPNQLTRRWRCELGQLRARNSAAVEHLPSRQAGRQSRTPSSRCAANSTAAASPLLPGQLMLRPCRLRSQIPTMRPPTLARR